MSLNFRKRDVLLNEKRGLLNDDFCENNKGWMDWEEVRFTNVFTLSRRFCQNGVAEGGSFIIDHSFTMEKLFQTEYYLKNV